MPWEVAVGCTEFDALLGRVAASIGTDGRLATGGDEADDGKLAARYFPFVHAASGGTLLRDATLKGEVAAAAEGSSSEERAVELALRREHTGGHAGDRQAAVRDAVHQVAYEVQALLQAVRSFYKRRILDDTPVMFRWVGVAFDFQVSRLVRPPVEMVASGRDDARVEAVTKLALWAVDMGGVSIQVRSAVSQYEAVLRRLRSEKGAAVLRRMGAKEDNGKSNLVVGDGGGKVLSSRMVVRELLTNAGYYRGCHDFMYLLSHCILKTVNEAVVESMGMVVDVHADPRRHLSSEKYVEEAVVHRNGPPLAQADPMIKAALDFWFKFHNQQGGGSWRFKQVQKRFFRATSIAVDNEERKQAKLPFLADAGEVEKAGSSAEEQEAARNVAAARGSSSSSSSR